MIQPSPTMAAGAKAAPPSPPLIGPVAQQHASSEGGPPDADNVRNDSSESDGAEAALAPLGSADTPISLEYDDGVYLWAMADGVRPLAQSLSPTHLMLALGVLLPLATTAPLLLKSQNGEATDIIQDSYVVQVTALTIVANSLLVYAVHRVFAAAATIERDLLESGAVGPYIYPGNRRSERRMTWTLTVGRVGDILRKVPVEEYVSQEDVSNGKCSTARMKRMLVHRGAAEAAERCEETGDLVKEVQRVRKFDEECAICAEEYAEGDVLRIGHCGHEFHSHCFDRWIYTFATDARPATHPTCPLCKATLQ